VTLQTERLLDDIGWRILEALQADARLSFSELGRQVGLSAPAAAERVRRMEDAGIIAGSRVDLALEKLFPVTAIVRISAPEENCTRLAACARGLEEVIEAHRVTGSDRLVLKLVAQSVDHLDGIIRQLSQFGTPTVSIVLSTRRQAVSHVRERGNQRLAAPQAVKGARR
jgi:Lrp/AsnC family leucine-responsive transcriptional regulator